MVMVMVVVILRVSEFIQVDCSGEAVFGVVAVIAIAIKLMSLSEHDVTAEEEKDGCDCQHDVEVLVVIVATGEGVGPLAVEPVDEDPTSNAQEHICHKR